MNTEKTLYRSRTDSVFAGVSGGLGKYFNIDPLLFRVLFVVLTFLAAGGLLLYIILWIVMPPEPWDYFNRNTHFNKISDMENENMDNTQKKDYSNRPYYHKPKNDGGLVVGIILIALGGMFLIDRLIPRIEFADMWPVLLIMVGIIIIVSQVKSRN